MLVGNNLRKAAYSSPSVFLSRGRGPVGSLGGTVFQGVGWGQFLGRTVLCVLQDGWHLWELNASSTRDHCFSQYSPRPAEHLLSNSGEPVPLPFSGSSCTGPLPGAPGGVSFPCFWGRRCAATPTQAFYYLQPLTVGRPHDWSKRMQLGVGRIDCIQDKDKGHLSHWISTLPKKGKEKISHYTNLSIQLPLLTLF